MHNAAFASLNLDWIYVPLPVRPDDVQQALMAYAEALCVARG